MTGSRTDEETMDRIRRQAFLFLTKPFDLFRLKRVLSALSAHDPNTFHELSDLEALHGIRRRKHSRTSAEAKKVRYAAAVPGTGERKQSYPGELLDISDGGTCIRTPHHLAPGSMVRFESSMNEARGIVRWSATDERSDLYVAGIQFVGEEES